MGPDHRSHELADRRRLRRSNDAAPSGIGRWVASKVGLGWRQIAADGSCDGALKDSGSPPLHRRTNRRNSADCRLTDESCDTGSLASDQSERAWIGSTTGRSPSRCQHRPYRTSSSSFRFDCRTIFGFANSRQLRLLSGTLAEPSSVAIVRSRSFTGLRFRAGRFGRALLSIGGVCPIEMGARTVAPSVSPSAATAVSSSGWARRHGSGVPYEHRPDPARQRRAGSPRNRGNWTAEATDNPHPSSAAPSPAWARRFAACRTSLANNVAPRNLSVSLLMRKRTADSETGRRTGMSRLRRPHVLVRWPRISGRWPS